MIVSFVHRFAGRAVVWVLDWSYVTYWQLRHLIGGRDASRYRSGHLAPVVLLPGVYETWQFLRPVADRLHAAGHPVHVIRGLGYNRGTVREMAAITADYLAANDLSGVTIVAHSKGGLIGKHLMVVDDSDGRIARLVAINTPFGGSRYAWFVPGRTLRAFAPTEATLVMLGANAAANSRIVSIYSSFDTVIPGGSRLPGARNIRLSGSGHFRVLGSARLLDVVAEVVDGGASDG